jgi:hypothetical protein
MDFTEGSDSHVERAVGIVLASRGDLETLGEYDLQKVDTTQDTFTGP